MTDQNGTNRPDQEWAEAARSSRDALVLLGYGITPRCLPDEAERCGGGFAVHAMAHFATIKAIADHQLMHLGPDLTDLHGAVYWSVREDLASNCEETHP